MIVESSRLKMIIRPNPSLKYVLLYGQKTGWTAQMLKGLEEGSRLDKYLWNSFLFNIDSNSKQYRSEFVFTKSRNGAIKFFICFPHWLCPGCGSQVFGFALSKFGWLQYRRTSVRELALCENSVWIQQWFLLSWTEIW